MQLDGEREMSFSLFKDTKYPFPAVCKLALGEVEIIMYLYVWKVLVEGIKCTIQVFLQNCHPTREDHFHTRSMRRIIRDIKPISWAENAQVEASRISLETWKQRRFFGYSFSINCVEEYSTCCSAEHHHRFLLILLRGDRSWTKLFRHYPSVFFSGTPILAWLCDPKDEEWRKINFPRRFSSVLYCKQLR